MSESVISIRNLTKTYKLYDNPVDRVKEVFHPFRKKYFHPFNALSDISFDVLKGETLGIIGRNGSGKSTLLQIVCGILQPTAGNVMVNGRVSALLELGAGFNPEFTGRENVYINGAILGLSRQEMDDRFGDIAAFADIGDFIDQPVKTYSSGMYVRLAFAVAINVDPDILIVDEALAVGDVRFQMKCIEKMKTIQKEKTILFVTHAIELTKRFCTKSLWLENGKIRMSGKSALVGDNYLDFMCQEKTNNSCNTPIKQNISSALPAKIIRLKIMNSKRQETATFNKGDDIVFSVTYDIIDEFIDNFLVGVALFDRQNTYIYGPNTGLDKVEIPVTRGRHKILYRLKKIPLLGGTYYIDVGLFDEKGMVCIDYKYRISKFIINSGYVAEGLCELEHDWEIVK